MFRITFKSRGGVTFNCPLSQVCTRKTDAEYEVSLVGASPSGVVCVRKEEYERIEAELKSAHNDCWSLRDKQITYYHRQTQ